MMDGDIVMGTDMTYIWKEGDSKVGLGNDGRRRCSGNGGRSSAVPRNGMRFSLTFSSPCESRIFADPTASLFTHFFTLTNQAFKSGRP